jgi:hypothetical protein
MSSKSRITPVNSTPIVSSNSSLEDGGNPAEKFPEKKIMNWAMQMQAREIQKLQQEVAESRKKEKVPKNYQNHYKYDVKIILQLTRLMFGIIVFLVTLIGYILLPKYLNNSHNLGKYSD